ncbi:nuclear transport factor 2 family protein [Streptomyces sp. JNUCC 63]
MDEIMSALPAAVSEFLEAVNARDPSRVAACFTEDAAYHFLVPQPPVTGRSAIEAAYTKVLGECTQVRWDVVAGAAAGHLVFLERVDRFWYDGREAAIECCGVFELGGGLIRVARDYADHRTWRERRAAAGG